MAAPRWAYLSLIAWIPGWLLIGQFEFKITIITLATLSLLPLLFPLRGILKHESRALIWGAYASLPAFLIGVMESWSNPAQRPGSLVQLGLVVVYWILVMVQAQHQRDQ